MDLVIDAKVITKAIGVIRDFSGIKTEMGSFIRIDADAERVRFSATDEITTATLSLARKDFPVDVKSEGSVFVKSESFLRIISLVHPLTADGTGCSNVILSDNDKAFSISYETIFRGGSIIKNDRNVPKDYGNKFLPVQDIKTPSFTIGSLELKKCLRKVHYAVGVEDIEKNLKSILIETLPDNKIVFSATNYFKFSQATLSLSTPVEDGLRLVLPAAFSRKLSKLLESAENNYPIHFLFDGRQVSIYFDNYYLTLKTPSIKTKFPDTSQAFEGTSSSCTLERKILVAMVRDILPVAEGDDCRATFQFDNNGCKVYSTGYLGGVSQGVTIHDLSEDVKLDFNSQYILDTIRAMDSDVIRLDFFSKKNRIAFYENSDSIEMKAVVSILR